MKPVSNTLASNTLKIDCSLKAYLGYLEHNSTTFNEVSSIYVK